MPETFEAIYDFEPQSDGDVRLRAGNKVEVLERMSVNWWKGKNLDSGETGVFPSNYVKSLGGGDEKFSRPAAPVPQQGGSAPPPQYYGQNGQSGNGQDYPKPYGGDEKNQYQAPPPANWGQQGGQQAYNNYGPPQQQYNNYGPPQQMMPQQVQQQPQPQPQQQEHRGHPHLAGIAKRFGDSVVFGAGATLGSDLINKIF